ncbi:MAG: LuxR C-terminal-related transcriptional regulator [Eubacterium sp.]|nr:LuxR C-terminal-related transcriptional regulator [Eubacterium sp.]
MKYVKVPTVFAKLKQGDEEFRPVIVMGAAICGKTASVRSFYKNKAYVYLSAHSGSLDDMPEISKIRCGVVIVDDLGFITDDESKFYVKKLLQDTSRQTVLITRGTFPGWLVNEALEYDFVRIVEKDFKLDGEGVKEFFDNRGLEISADEINEIAIESEGYPVTVLFFLNRYDQGEKMGEKLVEEVWKDYYHYVENKVFMELEHPVSEFLLTMSHFECFTIKMAEFVTGESRTHNIIEYCMEVGQLIEHHGDSCYVIRREIRKFLVWKSKQEYDREEIDRICSRAAHFYELQDDLQKALELYSKVGDNERVREILIRNAYRHMGNGHYFETRKFYFSLPESEIMDNPVLMAGMSMIYSITMQPAESEVWYKRLEEFHKNHLNDKEKRKEAKERLIYLQIALPHRGTKGIIPIIKKAAAMFVSREVSIPQMTATSNMPFLMNGSLDFSEWSRNDMQLYRLMSKPVQKILGKMGKGLPDCAIAESGFTKGTMEPYEVCLKANNAYEEALNSGTSEICFASAGVLIRQHLLSGQFAIAEKRLESIKKVLESRNEVKYYDNLRALETWFGLYRGDVGRARDFLEVAPDQHTEFCVIDRYQYIVKIRCLIALDKLSEALDLSGFLTKYFYEYERHIMWIENELLKAIIMYRMDNKKWREVLEKAFVKIEDYHFGRIVSMEGAAIMPLLQEIKDSKKNIPLFEQILEETSKMALSYPDYLKYIPKDEIHLTKRESEVLFMLCSGLSTEEICEKCGISYSGLKKHNRSIYQKLGVSNRAEAERKARWLGIIKQN